MREDGWHHPLLSGGAFSDSLVALLFGDQFGQEAAEYSIFLRVKPCRIALPKFATRSNIRITIAAPSSVISRVFVRRS